jgi:hypothetical protein
MSRLFWVTFGATAGVIALRTVRRKAAVLAPPVLVAGLTESVRSFLDDVRDGMAEREAELREQLGFTDGAGGP